MAHRDEENRRGFFACFKHSHFFVFLSHKMAEVRFVESMQILYTTTKKCNPLRFLNSDTGLIQESFPFIFCWSRNRRLPNYRGGDFQCKKIGRTKFGSLNFGYFRSNRGEKNWSRHRRLPSASPRIAAALGSEEVRAAFVPVRCVCARDPFAPQSWRSPRHGAAVMTNAFF